MSDVLRSFGYLPSNEDISDQVVLCVDDEDVARVPHVVRRNFDVEDIVGFCKFCGASIHSEDPATKTNVCFYCERDDRDDYAGIDR